MANQAWQSVLRYKRTSINAFYTPQISVMLRDTYFTNATTLQRIKVKVAGAWIAAVPKARVAGSWVVATFKFKQAGEWLS